MRLTFSPIGFVLFIVGSILIYLSKIFILDILGGVLIFGGLLAPVIERALKERKAATEETILPTLKEGEAKSLEAVRRTALAEGAISLTLAQYEVKTLTLEMEKLELLARERPAFRDLLLHSYSGLLLYAGELARDNLAFREILPQFYIGWYEMAAVYSDNLEERKRARWALMEMSKREDPSVRRRCVQALGALEEPDEEVMARLKEIARTDPVHSVRLEAQEAMEKPGKLRPEIAETEGD